MDGSTLKAFGLSSNCFRSDKIRNSTGWWIFDLYICGLSFKIIQYFLLRFHFQLTDLWLHRFQQCHCLEGLVTTDVYCALLSRLNKKKNVQFWLTEKVLFCNARFHVAIATRQKIVKLRWGVLAHPPYNPGITDPDYYLF